jgi:hypothetical protein
MKRENKPRACRGDIERDRTVAAELPLQPVGSCRAVRIRGDRGKDNKVDIVLRHVRHFHGALARDLAEVGRRSLLVRNPPLPYAGPRIYPFIRRIEEFLNVMIAQHLFREI